MNINNLKLIWSALKSTSISEIEMEQGDTKIKIVRKPEAQLQAIPAEKQKTEEAKEEMAVKNNLRVKIKSNTVGIFYRGKTKLGPPCVNLGDIIKAGDQIGLIESVGVVQPVVSDTEGRIVEIFMDNHNPVEYGQSLLELEKLE